MYKYILLHIDNRTQEKKHKTVMLYRTKKKKQKEKE